MSLQEHSTQWTRKLPPSSPPGPAPSDPKFAAGGWGWTPRRQCICHSATQSSIVRCPHWAPEGWPLTIAFTTVLAQSLGKLLLQNHTHTSYAKSQRIFLESPDTWEIGLPQLARRERVEDTRKRDRVPGSCDLESFPPCTGLGAGREVIVTPNRNGLWKDGEITHALRIDQLQREGKSPPYQECRENRSPHNSWWWPSAIRQLYRETEAEQRGIDLAFQKLHPLHSHQPLNSQFLLDQSRLHQRLACSEGVFYMRTLVQEGVTAGAASQAGSLAAFSATDAAFRAAEARAAAARTQEAIECLLKTEYLAGWLAHTEDSIHSWGTVDDPRNSSPPPGWGTRGWGTAGWGTAATGGWGTVGTGGTGGWGAVQDHKA
ncbi:hypothetical protein DFH08DRAFT_816165 [Mycena albidolilacea]|uniref:Uncharacterized protein n=1 Tax=Mycena albidolilacea TaxID=1033008 RepID=A0AAD6ZL56_9AGAR|nr:hypothetical protein DFH08DRAFT_816165 [Mycena albidolilacea]